MGMGLCPLLPALQKLTHNKKVNVMNLGGRIFFYNEKHEMKRVSCAPNPCICKMKLHMDLDPMDLIDFRPDGIFV
jgi:hypothetical protein